MVMLQKSPVSWREHGHVTEVAHLMKGEWSCYGGDSLMEGDIMTAKSLVEGCI